MNRPAAVRNRRSLRNLLIFPSGQIRLVFTVPAAGLLSMLVILQALKSALSQRLEAFVTAPRFDPGAIRELLGVVNGVFNLGILFLGLCSILVVTFGLVLSHRYYGPQIPILRALRSIRDGDYSARVELRPGDELRNVAKVINELGEKLGDKS